MQTTERIASVPSLSGAWEVRGCAPTRDISSSQSPALGMRLRDWLLLIPDYDGCAHAYPRFADSVRYVASRLGPGAERTLLLALGAKLRARAWSSFQHRLHRYSSVDEFLSSLHARFGGTGSENALLDELRRARQCADESLGDFAVRVDKLATRACGIFEEARVGEPGTREASIKFIREVALASFRRGLRNAELEARVSEFDPKTLDEAIGVAIAVENELRRRDELLKEVQESCFHSCKKRRRYR